MDRMPDEASAGHLMRRDSLGCQIIRLARLFENVLRRRVAEYGVVPGQFAQLLALYAEEPLTQRQLCLRLSVDQSTMARTLARMERDGLVTYAVDPDGGRRRHVVLTARARAMRAQLVAVADEVNETATRSVRTANRLGFVETVAQLIDNTRVGSPDTSG